MNTPPVERWTSLTPGLWLGLASSDGHIVIAHTDGRAPDDGGTVTSCEGAQAEIWASVVLTLTAFNERPNDWHAFMDHHHGRRDLLEAAKDAATLRNVVARQLDALRHAEAAME